MQTEDPYRAALAAAESELDEALKEADRANKRVQLVRRAVDGLRGLVGDDQAGGPPDGDGRHRHITLTDSAGATDTLTVTRTTSTDRVVAIVEGAAEPLKFADIIAEFRRRGWVDQTWEAPEAAMRQAIRRAARNELVHRLPGPRFVPLSLAEQYSAEDQNVQQELDDDNNENEE